MPQVNGQDAHFLKRVIQGEFAPRFYTLTGGSFDEMRLAVKALDYWRADHTSHGFFWVVNAQGIKALRVAGYSAVQEPDIRTRFIETAMSRDAGYRVPQESFHVTAYIDRRDGGGEWVLAATRELLVFVSEEYIARRMIEIDRRVKEVLPESNFLPADRYQAVRALAREVVESYSKAVTEVFSSATLGERSVAALRRGLAALRTFIDDQSENGEHSFAAVLVSGECMLYNSLHPVTRQLVAQAEARRQAERAAARQAAELRAVERKANAASITARYLQHDTKQRIADLASKAGCPISAADLKRIKKAALIGQLTANQTFCLWFIEEHPYFT